MDGTMHYGHRMRMVDDIKMKAKVHSHRSYTSDGLAKKEDNATCIATRSIAVVINLGDLYSNREMTINYNSLAEKATKLGIWMEASGGNRYTYLSSLDTPHEGLLVDIGSRKYTIVDEEDVALLPWREYQFRDKHASSYDTHLHRDIMERYLTPDDLVLVSNLHVIHLGDPLDNRRSNLRWVDGRFVLDRETGLPSDIRKRGHRYRVRITFDGETRSRTFMTKADAMVWWYNTKMEMISNEPWSITLRRLNGMSDE